MRRCPQCNKFLKKTDLIRCSKCETQNIIDSEDGELIGEQLELAIKEDAVRMQLGYQIESELEELPGQKLTQQIVSSSGLPPIESATTELHKAYEFLNRDFFEGKLPPVALTIQSRGKRMSLGWFTPWLSWQGEGVGLHEINISAEALNMPLEETIDTLLHEMVHLYCHINDIQDTSRGATFHNKEFKKQSELHGFFYDTPADKKYGWTFSKLKPETVEIIQAYPLDRDAFKLGRIAEPEQDKKKPNSYKWTCPSCELVLRTTKKEHKISNTQLEGSTTKMNVPIILYCGICSVEDDDGEMQLIPLYMEEVGGDDE